jgi:tRNA threonylcarbamoyladenosine biosynthesis protein TsaB
VKSLIIENSTENGTVAVAGEEGILARRKFSKGGELAVAIQEIFREFGLPDEIVVGIGPGSYTGLRVASATAIGIQLALGCPAFGCPSVFGYPDASYHVVGDARLGAVFLASIENKRLVRGPELLPAEEFQSLRTSLAAAPIFAIGPIPGCGDLPIIRPEAEYLIQCRESFTPSLEPLYLKEPHITVSKDKSLQGHAAGLSTKPTATTRRRIVE